MRILSVFVMFGLMLGFAACTKKEEVPNPAGEPAVEGSSAPAAGDAAPAPDAEEKKE